MKPRQAEVSIPLQPPGRGATPAAGPDGQPRDYVVWSLVNVLLGYGLTYLGCLCFPALVFSIKVRGGEGGWGGAARGPPPAIPAPARLGPLEPAKPSRDPRTAPPATPRANPARDSRHIPTPALTRDPPGPDPSDAPIRPPPPRTLPRPVTPTPNPTRTPLLSQHPQLRSPVPGAPDATLP